MPDLGPVFLCGETMKITRVLILAAILCAAFAAWLSYQGNNTGYAVPGSHLIKIKNGMSTDEIAELLHKAGLVKNPSAFKIEARINGLADKLQAGAYQIEGGLSNRLIFDTLTKGKISTVSFVVPEGFTVAKTAKKLEVEGLGKAEKFLALAKDYAPFNYMRDNTQTVIYRAEGFIFPATYEFPVDVTEKEILEACVKQFDMETRAAGIVKSAEERGMKIFDVVNIASMVELEAVYREEQPRIAGVFLKRMEVGMPIQSDTTIQYILGEQKEIVTFKDTEIDSPYNTYKYPGLPPGPIGSPGIGAMKAVLQPEKTDYLYFVAEKNGHHRFTKTYNEHLQAIKDIDGGK